MEEEAIKTRMDEEEAIRRITRLLEMGGTMLATHHDCGAPLFRYKGEVVCPVCSFEEVGRAKSASKEERVAVESREGPSNTGRGSITATEREEASGSGLGAGVGRLESSSSEPQDEGRKGHREGESGEMVAEEEADLVLKELKTVILQKIREISEKMGDEQDLGSLMSQLECVKEALKVLERLED